MLIEHWFSCEALETVHAKVLLIMFGLIKQESIEILNKDIMLIAVIVNSNKFNWSLYRSLEI